MDVEGSSSSLFRLSDKADPNFSAQTSGVIFGIVTQFKTERADDYNALNLVEWKKAWI